MFRAHIFRPFKCINATVSLTRLVRIENTQQLSPSARAKFKRAVINVRPLAERLPDVLPQNYFTFLSDFTRARRTHPVFCSPFLGRIV